MRKNWLIPLLILGVLLPPGAGAESGKKSTDSRFELGVGAGFPMLGGGVVGYWGGRKLPIVARLSAGLGAAADLGVHFAPESQFNPYVVASGGMLLLLLPFGASTELLTVGVSAGMKYRGFFVQGGPCLIASGSASGFAAQGMLGYTFAL